METTTRCGERCHVLGLIVLGLLVVGIGARETNAESRQDQVSSLPEASTEVLKPPGELPRPTPPAGERSTRMATPPPNVPPNDDCENMINLTAPGALCEDLEAGCVVPFSNVGATTDGPDHPECGSFGSDIWYVLYISGPPGRFQNFCGGSFPAADEASEGEKPSSGAGFR